MQISKNQYFPQYKLKLANIKDEEKAMFKFF